MKVLLSSYSCKPHMGSEPAIGWNLAVEMAKHHQVWVVTRTTNRLAIEAQLTKHPNPNLTFVYYDLPAWVYWAVNSKQAVQLRYPLWQLGVYAVFKQLHEQVGFDISQHITFARYWSPSSLARLPVPFIWGPVGGGESAPQAFVQEDSLRGRVFEATRHSARWVGERDPLVRLTAKRATLALATTSETAARLKTLGCTSVAILPAVALTDEELHTLASTPKPSQQPLRFLSMGRLLAWKGFQYGLTAFAQAKLANAEYWVVGSGPYEAKLRQLVARLGITQQVTFWGTLPRPEALRCLQACQVLVHPSLHDSGGFVVLEAMAARRPVLCLDLGGPGTLVTNETGVKVPALHPEQVTADLAKAMQCFAQQPLQLKSMGEAGYGLVREKYLWSAKGRVLTGLYESVVQNNALAPLLSGDSSTGAG